MMILQNLEQLPAAEDPIGQDLLFEAATGLVGPGDELPDRGLLEQLPMADQLGEFEWMAGVHRSPRFMPEHTRTSGEDGLTTRSSAVNVAILRPFLKFPRSGTPCKHLHSQA